MGKTDEKGRVSIFEEFKMTRRVFKAMGLNPVKAFVGVLAGLSGTLNAVVRQAKQGEIMNAYQIKRVERTIEGIDALTLFFAHHDWNSEKDEFEEE